MKKLNRKSVRTPPPPLSRPAPATYFHPFFNFFRFPPPSGVGNQNLLPPPLKNGGGGEIQTMIILILDVNNSIIYTTDCHMQFYYTHFCVHMIFLLKLKIFLDKNFLLTFPWSSNKFPDFPDRVEILSVDGNSKIKNQDLCFFMNTPGNSASF